MGLTSSKKVDTNTYELTVTVGEDQFAPAVDQAYRKNVKKMNIPGFRKGKAPKAIVYKMYGEGVFYEDAVNDLYPKAYSEAVEEAGLEPVAWPKVEVSSVGKEGFTFTASVIVKPEVEVSDYKGIKAVKAVKTVSDEDVGKEIDRLRHRGARIVTVERPAQMEDTVLIDFKGYVDGEAFENGSAENHSLKLGSGQFIPGFEEQIAGHSAGEEFDVNVKFPEDYHPELRGKDATFHISLHEVKEEELPALDDEFVKDVSEFDTLDELKAGIRERLQKQFDEQTQSDFEDALVDKVLENMKAEVPAEMIDSKISDLMRDYGYRLQSQGIPLEMYLQYTGQSPEDFKETFRAPADKQVRIRLALEKIAALEGLTATDDEVEEEYKRLAAQSRNDLDKIRGMIPQSEIREDLSVRKAIDLIRDSAVVLESEAKEAKKESKEEAQPKKPRRTRKAAVPAEPAE